MKIVLLAGKGESTNFMYHAIKEQYSIYAVILEDKVPAKRMIKQRIKKLGWLHVLNQLIFQTIVTRILRVTSKKRIEDLKSHYNLNASPIPELLQHHVSSVNSEICLKLLKKMDPDVILVNGTRIISKRILQITNAKFINTHVGITPLYRGVHGGYWALANNDAENCGVTIHEVDTGIDTGQVIRQVKISVFKQDNFVTYPYHQFAAAIAPLLDTLKDIERGQFKKMIKSNEKGKLYYHPTCTGYLYRRVFHGVK